MCQIWNGSIPSVIDYADCRTVLQAASEKEGIYQNSLQIFPVLEILGREEGKANNLKRYETKERVR